MSLLDKFESPPLYRRQFMTGRIPSPGDGPGAIHSRNLGCDETNLLNRCALVPSSAPFHLTEKVLNLRFPFSQPSVNPDIICAFIPEIIKSSYII
jgi:hypothetical protein